MHVAGSEQYSGIAAASAAWPGTTGAITYAGAFRGEEGNVVVTYTFDEDVTATEAVAEYESALALTVKVNGAVTLGTAVAAINEARYEGEQIITASVASGNRGNSRTWASNTADLTVTLTSGAGDARDILSGSLLGQLPKYKGDAVNYRCRLYARGFGNSSGAYAARLSTGMTHTLKAGERTIFEDAVVPRQSGAGSAAQPGVSVAFPFHGQDFPVDEFVASTGEDIVLDVDAAADSHYAYRFEAVPFPDIR